MQLSLEQIGSVVVHNLVESSLREVGVVDEAGQRSGIARRWRIRVIRSKDKLGGRDAVSEEATDLVGVCGSSAVPPDPTMARESANSSSSSLNFTLSCRLPSQLLLTGGRS